MDSRMSVLGRRLMDEIEIRPFNLKRAKRTLIKIILEHPATPWVFITAFLLFLFGGAANAQEDINSVGNRIIGELIILETMVKENPIIEDNVAIVMAIGLNEAKMILKAVLSDTQNLHADMINFERAFEFEPVSHPAETIPPAKLEPIF